MQVRPGSKRLSRHAIAACQAHHFAREQASARDASRAGTSEQSEMSERLLVVTNEGLTMYSLPGLALKGQAFRSQGAVAFAYNEERSVLAIIKGTALGAAAR